MSLPDLDLLEETASTIGHPEGWTRTYVPPMIAELRAAREVVKNMREMRHYLRNGSLKAAAMLAASSLEGYDKVVRP